MITVHLPPLPPIPPLPERLNGVEMPEAISSRLLDRVQRLPKINGYRDMSPYGPYIQRLCKYNPRYMEFGTFNGISATYALAGLILNKATDKKIVCVDLAWQEDIDELAVIAGDYGITFEFQCCPSHQAKMLPRAVYLLDSNHTALTVKHELIACAPYADTLLFHDTDLFGYIGNDGAPGIWAAIGEFLCYNREDWEVCEHLPLPDRPVGLTRLERRIRTA